MSDDRFVAWAAGVADIGMMVRPVRYPIKSGNGWGYRVMMTMYSLPRSVRKAWEVVMDVELREVRKGRGREWQVPAKDQERTMKKLLPFMQNDGDMRRGLEFKRLKRGEEKKLSVFTLWKEVRRGRLNG